MGKRPNQRGVALLIVISVISILTVVVTDLMAQMLVSHQIAINSKARVQSYYLAQSSLGLSKLLMYYTKKLQSEISKAGVDSSQLGSIGYEPLYKLFPLSSEMFRGLVAAQSSSEDAGETEGGEDDGSLMDDSSMLKGGSFLDKQKVEEFLDFEGDFNSEINEQSSRFSLNTVSKMTATSANYDIYKKILLEVLLTAEYKNFFENQEEDAEKLVHALADWVDLNDTVNEFEQVERGNEDSIYDDADYHVKNGKFLTISEARLIEGMGDDIFTKLEPFITVYHTDDKINVCVADQKYLEALILHYTKYSGCTPPLEEDDTEELETLRDTVMENCPNISAMASALNVALGIKTQDEVDDTLESGTAEQQSTVSKSDECKVNFQDLITDNNDIFQIKAKGYVGGIGREITVVLDTSGSTPSSWKTLFYQVQ
jgi:type II secretory pathway component PulK